MIRFRLVAPFCGALFLSACGGGSGPTGGAGGGADGAARLVLSSASPVAGVSWVLPGDPLPGWQAQLRQASTAALGDKARVLLRVVSHSAPQGESAAAVEWLVFAPGSQGLTNWELLQRSRAEGLPAVQAVMCAGPHGNPVPCTLEWR